jgi:PilZ domain-containing protein
MNSKMGGMNERRTTRRYDLSLPVLVRAPAEKMSDSQMGKTLDISTRGLYFVMDQNLREGSRLDLTLTLPAKVTSGAEVFVHVMGKVLRIEPRIEDGSTRLGVAAVIERYDIIRGEVARA